MAKAIQRDFSHGEFYIRYPSETRKKFTVVHRTGRGTGKQKAVTLRLPEIVSANHLYKTGKITREQAYDSLCHLVEKLRSKVKVTPRGRKKQVIVFHPQNKKLLDQYFAKVYGARELAHPENAYSRLKRAVRALGNVPLSTASDVEIFAAIKKFDETPKGRKRLMSSLCQILKFIGRTDVLVPRIKKVRPKIKRLTLEEFSAVAETIKDDSFRKLCWTFFSTGCRPGELMALTPDSLNKAERSIFVADQVDMETGQEGQPTKTGEQRHVGIIPEGYDIVIEWLKVSGVERERLRKSRLSQEFRKHVVKLFPEKENIVFYDLRHSYATALLDRGASIELVAQSLGNSISVCQEHYVGYTLTNAGVAALNKILYGGSR